MTWSHSRLNTFSQCPYQFYLKYICQADEEKMFFSEYGKFIHDILAGYHSGKITAAGALDMYLTGFADHATGISPANDIRVSYFKQGLASMKALSPIAGKILGIEERVSFDVFGYPFIGFVDMVYEDADNKLCILDHKSRALKPRSTRKKPTKTDIELDFYLRQLYLYSIPIAEKYGRYPDFLEFNCYRTQERIKESFCLDALNDAKRWAISTIHEIRNESEWHPDLEMWKCKYLCGFCNQCEYTEIAEWR